MSSGGVGPDAVTWTFPTVNLMEQKSRSVRKVRENSMKYKNGVFSHCLAVSNSACFGHI